MSDLVYKFTFPKRALGLDVTVTDAAGQTVTPDEDPTLVLTASNGNAYIQFSLDETAAPYSGAVQSARAGVFAYSSEGRVDLAASLAAGGGGTTDGASRGSLHLKATVVDADASTEEWADGTGAPFALVLDEEAQGDEPIPEWADETAGVYSIIEPGTYVACIAGRGSATYDEVPTAVYIDMYHNDLTGINWGWSHDGNDDSPAFTPAETTELPFGVKDGSSITGLGGNAVPVSLAGLTADNYGDLTGNPLVSIDAKLCVTKFGAATRYTEADFS